ncbi:MAG: RNA methyltransferase [Bacteroidota bacterium]
MISTSQIKLISSLKLKKNRDFHSLFIAEGAKITEELIRSSNSIKIQTVFGIEDWIIENQKLLENFGINYQIITEEQLSRISQLQTPNKVLALCHKLENKKPSENFSLALALDNISDPGNLGTIVRIADWFGIDTIICSENTVDIYNPKVIQATMGSFLRVKLFYTKLASYLKDSNKNIYGTLLDGENIYKTDIKSNSIIVIGNEANGISPEIEKLVTHKIKIPSYPHTNTENNPESLNAAIATSITVAEFKRQLL